MRRFLVSAVIFLTACAPGAMTQLTEAEKSIETIIELPGLSEADIYASSRKWLSEKFRSSRAVIESENSVTSTIVGNGVIRYPCAGLECVVRGTWTVPFRLKIEASDGKVRTIFSNIQLSMPPSGTDYSATDSAGGVAPVWRKADMNVIKPALLKLNRQLKAYIINNQKK